jgi:hypothetical protein
MARMLICGTLIAIPMIVLAPMNAAYAGNVGARGPTTSGNYHGGPGTGCKGPACSIKGPTPRTNKMQHCYTVSPPPGSGGRPYTKCD